MSIISIFFIITSILLQIQTINSSQTLSPFTILPKPILPSHNSPSRSPSPSPHHHHLRKHKKHKSTLSSQAPPPAKHDHLFFSPAPSPSASSSETLPVFPANISSLTPTKNTTSKSSTKLIAIVISLALFSVAVIAYASVLVIQHRRRQQQQNPVSIIKRSQSIRLFPPNGPSSDTTSLSFNSPELRPLPSLPKHSYFNSAYERNYHEEEFFTPLGFSGSPNAEVSSSCYITGAENFRSRSLNSEITSSRSASFSQTISRCPSVASVASNSTSRTLSHHSFINFAIPQRKNAEYTLNSDEVVINLPPNPPLSLPSRYRKRWFESEGTSNVSPEIKFPVMPFTEWLNNEGGETSDHNFKPKLKPLRWDNVKVNSQT